MKLFEMRSEQKAFEWRSRERAARMQGLVALFQSGEITVRKFRHLAGQLKAAHRTDQRTTGLRSDTPSLV